MSLLPAADAASEAVTSTPVRMTTDRYGFLIPNEGTPGASTSASDNSPAMTKEMTRVKKWQKMLGEVPPMVPVVLTLIELLQSRVVVCQDLLHTAMLLLVHENKHGAIIMKAPCFERWRCQTHTAAFI